MRGSWLKHVAAPLAVCLAATGAATAGMTGVTLGSGASATNPAFLPIGDGKVTTSGPKRGYVYSCANAGAPGGGSAGGPPGGAGAFKDGPWIRGDGTFDLNAKATVNGRVRWSNARFSDRRRGKRRILSGNGLPVKQTTGKFPIQPGDDAYSYDRNPNSIAAQRERYSLPRHPKKAARPHCLPMGAIGVAKNGVAIFNALDAQDRDAVAHEVQDSCGGHPQQRGIYHYHSIPSCLTRGQSTHRASGLVGFALDGYPIYGPRGAGGRLLTNDDLDACHGRVSRVWLDGRWQRIYHYNATLEYPYTLGCFHGTPVASGG